MDYYEIYGNLFWQNPAEALFQGTGNVLFYDNICVNYSGGSGVAIQSHNGFQPRDIKVFHNTIISNNYYNWLIEYMLSIFLSLNFSIFKQKIKDLCKLLYKIVGFVHNIK